MNGSTRNLKASLAASYNELVSSFTALSCDTVGNYTVGKIIGKGSYGKAYQATHKFLGCKVVLKSTPKSEAPNLAREIHHHRHLHHPHIAQLYEVVVTENKVWLVLELCTNGELYDYLLSKKQLDENEAQMIFSQVCGAVSYIHDKGIVHRDLKLENVFLDRKYNVKLGDFGFTRENDKTLLSTWCGSLSYCAPEVVRGDKYQGQPVDVWSLGIILYALLSGHLPFDDDDESVTRNMILNERQAYPESVSPLAKDLLDKMLSKDPASRPSAAEVLAHPFLSAHSATQVLHLTQPYVPTFQTRMERTVLERLGVAGIETEQVVTHVLDYRCDSLCGWWWLSLQRERRREKRHRAAAARRSTELINDAGGHPVRSSRHHSRSRNGSRDLTNTAGSGYSFLSIDKVRRTDSSSLQVSPGQSALDLPKTVKVASEAKSNVKVRPAMPARESSSSSPMTPKRHQSEPKNVTRISSTPIRDDVNLVRATTESAERTKELQHRKHGIMQTFKHWWAEQTKSTRQGSPTLVHNSPVTPRAVEPSQLVVKPVQSTLVLPPVSPIPSSPALGHQRPNYRRRRSSQLSVSSRGSSTVRTVRRRTIPNLQIALPPPSATEAVGSPSPTIVTPSATYFDKSHAPMQRTMSASSNHSSVASYRGSGQAGHSKASSTSSNSTFASTRSIRAPRNPLKVMPSTPPPFMIAHRGGYRERNVFESSLGGPHASVAFATRKKAKRGVLLQTQTKVKTRRPTSLHEVEEEEEEEGGEDEEDVEGSSVLGEGEGDEFIDVEDAEESEEGVTHLNEAPSQGAGLLDLAEEKEPDDGNFELERPSRRAIVTE